MSGARAIDAARRRGRRAGLAVALIAAATFGTNLAWIGGHLDWLRPLEPGQLAPAFDLPVIGAGGAPTGARVTRDGLRGKVVVLEFWATWCGPCLASLPQLAHAARQWGDRATAIAVNVDDARKARLVADGPALRGSPVVVVSDAGDAATRYQVGAIPHVVVIDAQGVVRLVARGGGAAALADRAVARLLAAPARE